ncbi:hypothetical protein T10_2093 [Trichinella papuae]|uniref:Secreted protein n=1 Tax=Trichinella papuae TaxID=268474 RepID=A0A0V1M931_9BILA|nr:hypothetical protein T10_2093 [Trichinella papuae]
MCLFKLSSAVVSKFLTIAGLEVAAFHFQPLLCNNCCTFFKADYVAFLLSTQDLEKMLKFFIVNVSQSMDPLEKNGQLYVIQFCNSTPPYFSCSPHANNH